METKDFMHHTVTYYFCY